LPGCLGFVSVPWALGTPTGRAAVNGERPAPGQASRAILAGGDHPGENVSIRAWVTSALDGGR